MEKEITKESILDEFEVVFGHKFSVDKRFFTLREWLDAKLTRWEAEKLGKQ